MSRRKNDVIRATRDLNVDQLVLALDLHRLDAGRARIGVLREARLLHRSVLRRKKQMLVVGERTYGDKSGDLRFRGNVDEIDDRLALCRTSRLRDLVDFEPEAAAVLGEDEDVVVRRRDEEMLNKIFVLERCAIVAAPAPPLLLDC